MKAFAEFTRTTLIGGVLVLLPLYLAILLLLKAVKAVMGLVAPITASVPASAEFRQLIAILIILVACFIAGLRCAHRARRSGYPEIAARRAGEDSGLQAPAQRDSSTERR